MQQLRFKNRLMTQNNKNWKNAMGICYKNGYYHSNTTSNDDKGFDQAQRWIEYALYFFIQVIMCIMFDVIFDSETTNSIVVCDQLYYRFKNQ